MIKGRSFKNEFAIELNTIIDCGSDYFGLYYDRFRLKQFISTMGHKIDEDNKQILEDVEHEDPEIRESILKQFHLDNSLNHFKDILLKSIFIISYSNFEKHLKDTCLVCGKFNPISELSKFRNRYSNLPDFEVYRKYLTDEMKIELDSIDSKWATLVNYKEIRKSIVHYGSEIEDNQKFSFFSTNKNISVEFNNITIINERFVDSFIELASEILEEIIELMNNQLDLIHRS